MNLKQAGLLLAALLLTVLLGTALFSQLERGDILRILSGMNPGYLFGGFLLYLLTQIARGVRFHLLLNREIGLRGLLPIVFVHNLMIGVLPARTGELSYPYLLRRLKGRSVAEGVSTLFLARIFDIITITLLFFFSMMAVPDLPELFLGLVWIILALLLILTALLLGFLFLGGLLLGWTERILARFSLEKGRTGTFLLQKGSLVNSGLTRVREGGYLRQIVPLSFAIWLSFYASVVLLLSGMGTGLPLVEVVLGMTFVVLSSTLPLQGVAGFGTNEGAWTLAFVPLGMPLETAIATGFSVHILLLLFSIVTGGCGGLMMRKAFSRQGT